MNVLIVTDKPSASYQIMDTLQRVQPWPGAMVTIFPTMMLGLYRFQLPDGLVASDLPFVGHVRMQPGSRFASRSEEHVWPAYRGVCGDLAGGWATPEVMHREDLSRKAASAPGFLRDNALGRALTCPERIGSSLEALVRASDVVVKATNPDSRGAVTMLDILGMGRRDAGVVAGGLWPGKVILDARMASFAQKDMDRLFADLAPGKAVAEPCLGRASLWRPGLLHEQYGLAKDHFDYNWIVNASALLAAPLRAAGVAGTVRSGGRDVQSAVLVSKNMLLLLLHVARMEDHDWREHDLIQLMFDWKGTGKYPLVKWGSNFGSEASRVQIVLNLVDLGLLERDGRAVRLTGAGHRFSDLLPKSAYDPDLPFRLDAWCRDWPRSRSAVEAYLRRFFGNIKRTNGMASMAGMPDAQAAVAAMMSRGMTTDRIATAAQISEATVLRVQDGGSITPAQARGLGLAAGRLGQS